MPYNEQSRAPKGRSLFQHGRRKEEGTQLVFVIPKRIRDTVIVTSKLLNEVVERHFPSFMFHSFVVLLSKQSYSLILVTNSVNTGYRRHYSARRKVIVTGERQCSQFNSRNDIKSLLGDIPYITELWHYSYNVRRDINFAGSLSW